ncbi:hypothetical protein [Burkholderia stagnalis]|uniref:hypothetical protein n=1 Tax=Burkholderia stagnalis TaxID=1503054 RepID=UPI000A53D765|nr:hypothetical protein [Burkholderia stagnalis]
MTDEHEKSPLTHNASGQGNGSAFVARGLSVEDNGSARGNFSPGESRADTLTDRIDDLRNAVEFLDACRAEPDTASAVGSFKDALEWLEKSARALLSAPYVELTEKSPVPQALPPAVLDALRFYANGSHFNIDSSRQDFDTVSGELVNWLCSTRDDDTTMIEDGSIAKAALCGKPLAFDDPEPPVEGEVFGTHSAAASADERATPARANGIVNLTQYAFELVGAIERMADSPGHAAVVAQAKVLRRELVMATSESLFGEDALARAPEAAFQSRVQPWLLECFGAEIASNRAERNHRFLEEALELVQACGCTASEAHQLVDYTFSRPLGEPTQEIGGVMVTLAALCLANGRDMHAAAEAELARVWTKVEQIRAKQAAKPRHSPLPIAVASVQSGHVSAGRDHALTLLEQVRDEGSRV